ncbi:MAG TPA: hypothetical protein VMR76_02185 [Candidatus Saccharimonadia bacterium]|nr:hypothetical protein [Candidatus Saccharimonadia bacterium]
MLVYINKLFTMVFMFDAYKPPTLESLDAKASTLATGFGAEIDDDTGLEVVARFDPEIGTVRDELRLVFGGLHEWALTYRFSPLKSMHFNIPTTLQDTQPTMPNPEKLTYSRTQSGLFINLENSRPIRARHNNRAESNQLLHKMLNVLRFSTTR